MKTVGNTQTPLEISDKTPMDLARTPTGKVKPLNPLTRKSQKNQSLIELAELRGGKRYDE